MPYVLELTSDDPEDGTSMAIALVVLRREDGFMLALPVGYLRDDIVDQGTDGGLDEVLGPTRVVRVPAGIMTAGGIQPLEDSTVGVVLVDVLAEASSFINLE